MLFKTIKNLFFFCSLTLIFIAYADEPTRWQKPVLESKAPKTGQQASSEGPKISQQRKTEQPTEKQPDEEHKSKEQEPSKTAEPSPEKQQLPKTSPETPKEQASSGIGSKFGTFWSKFTTKSQAQAVQKKQTEVQKKPADQPGFSPDTVRQAKIDQGTRYVATLARHPEKVASMLPQRPAAIDKLLTSKTLSQAELRKIQKSKEVQDYMNTYLHAVESVGEHFLAVAKSKNPDYLSGTVIVEDKNGALHKFLRDYVEITNKLSNGPQANVDKPSFFANSRAYGRISSHFGKNYRYGSDASKKAGKPPHYGIDLDNPLRTTTKDNPKPEEVRSHLLFGKIESDRPFLFMKFETHGLGGKKDTVLHGINYVRRQGSMKMEKVKARTSSQKKAVSAASPEEDKFALKDSRENTPKIILEEYNKLLKKSGLTEKEQKALLNEAKACGVSSILRQIQGKGHFGALEEKIRKTYGDENLDIRMGNEIIVRDKDLQQLQPAS